MCYIFLQVRVFCTGPMMPYMAQYLQTMYKISVSIPDPNVWKIQHNTCDFEGGIWLVRHKRYTHFYKYHQKNRPFVYAHMILHCISIDVTDGILTYGRQ